MPRTKVTVTALCSPLRWLQSLRPLTLSCHWMTEVKTNSWADMGISNQVELRSKHKIMFKHTPPNAYDSASEWLHNSIHLRNLSTRGSKIPTTKASFLLLKKNHLIPISVAHIQIGMEPSIGANLPGTAPLKKTNSLSSTIRQISTFS